MPPPPPRHVLRVVVAAAALLYVLSETPDPSTIPNCAPYQCPGGGPNISYPFWHHDPKSDSYCGYVGLDLACVNGTAAVTTATHTYFLDHVDYESRTVRVIDADALKGAPSSCPSINQNLTYEQVFPLYTTSADVNLTLFLDCLQPYSKNNLPPYYGPTCPSAGPWFVFPSDKVPAVHALALASACKQAVVVAALKNEVDGGNLTGRLLEVLRKGFELQWLASELKECKDCEESGGLCGYKNVSGPSVPGSAGLVFVCNCPEGQTVYMCGSEGKSATRSRNLVIGFSVAGSLLLLACAAIVLFWRRRLKRLSSSMRSLFRSSSSEVSSHGKDPESFSSSYYQTPMFSYKELEDATGGFDPSKELGDGGFGTVYKGKLKDGRIVAVKRLYENNFRRMQQFRNEVEILNRLRHQNLVTLYGCTPKDSPKLMLVYEFVSNGTVADHLHGPRSGERILTWALRMSIATETAEALAYLHAVQPQIVHRDVKTSNILLDTDLHVKVADFGLSRLFPTPAATHVSTAPQGTPGYLDPEYHQCYHLTDKSDVYSFGVVLVELLTSMPAVDITRDRNEINLSNIALSRIPQGRVGEIVDPGLGYGSDCEVRRMVGEVAEIAFRCLQGERDLRPTMDEVLQLLKSIAAGGPCGGMEVKAPPSKVKSSNNNVIVQVDDKQARDDTYLLDSPPFSPDSDGVIEWPSRSTTPSTSQ